MNTCSTCPSPLSSSFEEDLRRCLSCIKSNVKSLEDIDILLKEKDDHIQRLSEENTKLLVSLKEMNSIVLAEEAGKRAAEGGLPWNQNPHRQDEKEFSAWLFGWERVELGRQTLRALAVLKWMLGNLEALKELATGLGQDEIAVRLGTLETKCRTMLE